MPTTQLDPGGDSRRRDPDLDGANNDPRCRTVRPPIGELKLTPDERAMLDGDAGAAAQLAMRVLCRMAPLYGADSLLPVTRAHIDGVILSGDAGLEFAERLAALDGRVTVPTTLNVMSMDRERWRTLGQDSAYADRAWRLGQAYLQMGAMPTFTCAPYQTIEAPTFGEQIAWSESNAVAYANSAIGARTNRYGDFLDICCAIAGRVPASGLHLDKPRLATVALELDPLPANLAQRDDFYPVLGYLLGPMLGDEIGVVAGLDVMPSADQLKALLAAAASSGSVALLHLAGITPEAATVAEALGGRPPARRERISFQTLQRARAALTTSAESAIDVVAFGSPHCSLAEARALAPLMAGRRAAPGTDVFITTSRAVRDLLRETGDLAVLEAFGAFVTADTCIVVAPLIRPTARVLMTNSAKYAHYGPGILGVESVFGTTEECVESAIAGKFVRQASPWDA